MATRRDIVQAKFNIDLPLSRSQPMTRRPKHRIPRRHLAAELDALQWKARVWRRLARAWTFLLFILVNATLFVRPVRFSLRSKMPIYAFLFTIALLVAFPRLA